MVPNPRRLIVLTLYQLSLVIGIVMFPLAVLTRKAGVPLPFHRVVSRLGEAYERTNPQ